MPNNYQNVHIFCFLSCCIKTERYVYSPETTSALLTCIHVFILGGTFTVAKSINDLHLYIAKAYLQHNSSSYHFNHILQF